MSNETQDKTESMEMGTRPVAEHEWLQKLVGEWKVTTEMVMGPGGPTETSEGTETVRSLGGLWVVGEGRSRMPNGVEMESVNGLGYDVSFREYRGYWVASMSSALWKSVGTLSEDAKTMTLDCEGPDMVQDGKTAMYRDVIELIDENTRTLTSFGQDEHGEWQQFMKATYRRM